MMVFVGLSIVYGTFHTILESLFGCLGLWFPYSESTKNTHQLGALVFLCLSSSLCGFLAWGIYII